MPKLTKKLKEEWVSALRSGKYKQGRGYLRNKEDLYCCLGVLCNIINPDKWSYIKENEVYIYYNNIYDARELYQLKDDDQSMLIGLNDEDYLSFSEIADIIERTL